MTEIRIDSGIPVPEMKKGGRGNGKYPYNDLKVGESFLVTDLAMQSVCNKNWRYGKRLGRRFVARSEGEFVRVWRSE